MCAQEQLSRGLHHVFAGARPRGRTPVTEARGRGQGWQGRGLKASSSARPRAPRPTAVAGKGRRRWGGATGVSSAADRVYIRRRVDFSRAVRGPQESRRLRTGRLTPRAQGPRAWVGHLG